MPTEDATDAPSVVESAPEVETPEVDEPTAVEEVDDGPIDLDAEPIPTETESAEQEADADPDAEQEAEEGEEAEVEAELIEFNFGGNKLEVNKGDLTPELEAKVQEFSDNLWSDYTKKTQANADEAKTNAEARDAVAKITSLNGEALQTYTKGLQLRQEIEQLAQVDVNSLWQSEPDRARQISDALASKQAEFQSIVGIVGQQEAALDEAHQADLVQRTEKGKATLDRSIKDFSTKIAPEVVEYVVKDGMSQADADRWATNPQMTQYAYKAMMYDRMQAKAKAPKSRPAQTKPVAPIRSAGKVAQNQNLDTMSDKAFRKEMGLATN